jgi:hypothetical protein
MAPTLGEPTNRTVGHDNGDNRQLKLNLLDLGVPKQLTRPYLVDDSFRDLVSHASYIRSGSSSSGNRVATNRTNRRDDSKYEGMLNDRAKIRCDVARYDPRLAAM